MLDEERHVIRSNLEEFLVHALPFLLPVEPGPVGRVIPTAWGAEPLRSLIVSGDDPPPVWPDPRGSGRGPQVAPVSELAPALAQGDRRLGEWFALIDGIRIGRARERTLAADELRKRIWTEAAHS